jgi:hypothetical protein
MVRSVSHFLIVFDRAEGRVISEREFAEHRTALEERFRAERDHRANADIEIVVLSAESKEALRLTHARYFQSVSSMAKAQKATARATAAARAAGATRQ